MMSCIRSAVSGIVLSLVPAAIPGAAIAELTASQAYQSLRAMAVEQGGELESASMVDSGSIVLLSQVRIGAKGFPGNWKLAPEWMRLAELGDGTVEVSVPEVIPIETSILGVHKTAGTMVLSGFRGLMSSGDDGVTLTMSGDSLQQFAGFSDPGRGMDRHLQAAMLNWRAALRSGGADENSVFASIRSKSLSLAVLNGSGRHVFQGSFNRFRAEYSGGFRNLFDFAADPFSMDWFHTNMRFASAKALYAPDPENGKHIAMRSGRFSSRFSSRPGRVSGALTNADFTIQTVTNGAVQDSFRISSVNLESGITAGKNSGTTEIAAAVELAGVEINSHLLAMLVRENGDSDFPSQLPPGRFALDGSVTMPSSQAQQMLAGDELEFRPSDIIDWELDSFGLEFLGASLTAQGRIRQKARAAPDLGFLPVGRLSAEISGLKGVVGLLRAVGAMNRNGEIAVRMLLSVGRANSDDRFGYEIVFDDDGGIIINNFSIR